ncbi:MAG: hypothetical protein HC820_02410 [Hydrococcus sp. RM1_1_31]|nr:hypothetical protein [Hydrococcus sp. RM1_1_31]
MDVTEAGTRSPLQSVLCRSTAEQSINPIAAIFKLVEDAIQNLSLAIALTSAGWQK